MTKISFTFEVEIEEQPLDERMVGMDVHRGTVYLGHAQVFHTMVTSPGGPYAHREMCDDVVRAFAKHLAIGLDR